MANPNIERVTLTLLIITPIGIFYKAVGDYCNYLSFKATSDNAMNENVAWIEGVHTYLLAIANFYKQFSDVSTYAVIFNINLIFLLHWRCFRNECYLLQYYSSWMETYNCRPFTLDSVPNDAVSDSPRVVITERLLNTVCIKFKTTLG